MTRGRPRQREPKDTEFSLYLRGVLDRVSAAKVVDLCGVDRSTVSRWASGDMAPRPEKPVRAVLDAAMRGAATPAIPARPSQPMGQSEVDTADWEALMADAGGQEAFRKLARVFKSRKEHPDVWDAITRNLTIFEKSVGQDETAPTSAKKRQRARRGR